RCGELLDDMQWLDKVTNVTPLLTALKVPAATRFLTALPTQGPTLRELGLAEDQTCRWSPACLRLVVASMACRPDATGQAVREELAKRGASPATLSKIDPAGLIETLRSAASGPERRLHMTMNELRWIPPCYKAVLIKRAVPNQRDRFPVRSLVGAVQRCSEPMANGNVWPRTLPVYRNVPRSYRPHSWELDVAIAKYREICRTGPYRLAA